MTDLDYEDMTLCTKECVDKPCDNVDCIYYKECLEEWERETE